MADRKTCLTKHRNVESKSKFCEVLNSACEEIFGAINYFNEFQASVILI